MSLYPLQFTPQYKYRIWGGDKLKTVLNKSYKGFKVGESWEISDIKDSETIVSNGILKNKTIKELIRIYGSDFLGNKVYEKFKEEFPLLIKFIDAKKPLSIQVHPNNQLALEKHNSLGKNEMWYVMEADQNAELIVGFDKEMTKNEYNQIIKKGKLLNVLHREKVTLGDVFNIPAGRVHAIGAGVLLAEIQQNSDITYRIYDYNRVDTETGKLRELHTELAADAVDLSINKSYKTDYKTTKNGSEKLIHTPYFKTNLLQLEGSIKKDLSLIDSFSIYICVKGSFSMVFNGATFKIEKGQTILLPAIINKFTITGDATILEVSI